jgi:actin-related protein 5
MLQTHCSFAVPSYHSLLSSLKQPSTLTASTRIIQFPFTTLVQEEKTDEELARIAEKRKEQGRKLQEISAAKRIEKVECAAFWNW